MVLQNALGDLALDDTVQALVSALQALQSQIAELQHDAQAFPPRALQYARTTTDQLRVNVDSGSINVLPFFGNSGAGTSPGAVNYQLWYQPNAVFSLDQREQQRELSQQTFNAVRNGRWTFS